MTMRFGTLLVLAGAAAMALAPTAWAASVTGQIRYVDPSARTIKFQDGRIVQVEPGTTFWVDGRQVSLENMRAGTVVEMRTPAAPPAAMAGHPLIDSSGVVKTVDAGARRVTFEDGRTLQLSDASQVWQDPTGSEAAALDAIRPGDRILVQRAWPTSFLRSDSGPLDTRHYVMGTVLRADPARAVLRLDDGRTFKITPTTKLGDGTHALRISDLRRGDQVVIWHSADIPGDDTPVRSSYSLDRAAPDQAALRGELATFTADEILVIRRPQAS